MKAVRGGPEWRAKISSTLTGVPRGGKRPRAQYMREYMRDYRRGIRRRPIPVDPWKGVWYG